MLSFPLIKSEVFWMSNKHNYFIPGGLLLGLGIGLAINRAGPGLFIGLGIGFILTAFVPKVKVKK